MAGSFENNSEEKNRCKEGLDGSSQAVNSNNLLDNLWRARDLEISNLWQRSIFLATFIALLFTLFFSQFNKIIDKKYSIEVNLQNEPTQIIAGVNPSETKFKYYGEGGVFVFNIDQSQIANSYNGLNEFICLVLICEFGLIMSTLWVAMARGSKTSYERIEGGIDVFQKQANDLFDNTVADLKRKMWFERIYSFGTKYYFPVHGDLKTPNKVSYRASIKKGCFYSLSKINIILGYIFMLVWFGLLILSVSITAPIELENYIIQTVLLFLVANFICFMIIDYLVLSDNRMSFLSYIIMRIYSEPFFLNTRAFGRDPLKNQNLFLKNFFFKEDRFKKNNEADAVIHILRAYCLQSEYSLQLRLIKSLLYCYDDPCNCFERQLSVIKRVWSDDITREIIETSMMYRLGLPKEGIEIFTKEGLLELTLIQHDDECSFFYSSSRALKVLGRNIRLYSELDWRKVKSFESNKKFFKRYKDCTLNDIKGGRRYILSDHPIDKTGIQYIVISCCANLNWYDVNFSKLDKTAKKIEQCETEEPSYSIEYFNTDGKKLKAISGLMRTFISRQPTKDGTPADE